MNPLQTYNFVPTTVNGNQFLSFNQPGYYMTDYRNNTDTYGYLIADAKNNGAMSGHQLRQYMQDNALEISDKFLKTTANQFLGMQLLGAPNTCTGSEPGIIYSGGKPLIDDTGSTQKFSKQCTVPGESCMMLWKNTPMPQQGPHCQVPPSEGYYPSFSLLN